MPAPRHRCARPAPARWHRAAARELARPRRLRLARAGRRVGRGERLRGLGGAARRRRSRTVCRALARRRGRAEHIGERSGRCLARLLRARTGRRGRDGHDRPAPHRRRGPFRDPRRDPRARGRSHGNRGRRLPVPARGRRGCRRSRVARPAARARRLRGPGDPSRRRPRRLDDGPAAAAPAGWTGRHAAARRVEPGAGRRMHRQGAARRADPAAGGRARRRRDRPRGRDAARDPGRRSCAGC